MHVVPCRSQQLSFLSMDVLTEASAPEAAPHKGLIFLYRLVSGMCTRPR